jgi:hypothetical protein
MGGAPVRPVVDGRRILQGGVIPPSSRGERLNRLALWWMLSAGRSRVCEYSRKVRAPEGALPGNAWAVPRGTDGQCNREQTADGFGSPEHRQG